MRLDLYNINPVFGGSSSEGEALAPFPVFMRDRDVEILNVELILALPLNHIELTLVI